MRLVISGASNEGIAGALSISLNTVKMHLQNIFGKLRIKRRSQLPALYIAAATRRTAE
ncbi:MAG: LuxR C-terminal-related transcriptional regulator [Bacillota bacterium]